ncbi:general substrate transporter [Aspergillus pseudoustus]|uniref:General substrate transporter n=1 Tax=Aspergillus pseudoustus TaxID=1810923 RepID=A0ABR4JI52_9EURO
MDPSTQHITTRRFDKWWKDLSLCKLLAWQATILVSQMTSGFDVTVIGSFQSMRPWVKDMGHPDPSRVGLITSVMFVGGFAGALVAPLMADYFGRRMGMLTGSIFTFLGAVVQTAAQNSDMFIGGRFLIGLGLSFTCVAGPSLLFELARPSMRGTIASMFNVFWYVGSIIAAWTCFGTGHMSNSWSWRIPSLLQAVPALVVMSSVLGGLPESPRWLCRKGRTAEAQQLLAKYHGYGDQNYPVVLQELEEIQITLQAEHNAKTSGQSGWKILYQSPANRKRIALVCTVALLTLWNGQGVISYYFSPILTSVGITSTPQQTGINGGLQIVNLLSSLTGAFLADRIGRRPLWLASFIGMTFANVPLTISSAMYVDHGSKAASYVVVVFLFLYDAVFNVANNPLLYCYPTEILPFAIRAKGLGIQVAVSQAALTVNQYVNPIALDRIGYYYYIFYLGMLILGILIIYFTFPETKGKSEVELAALFKDGPAHGNGNVRTLEGLEDGLDSQATPCENEKGGVEAIKSEKL